MTPQEKAIELVYEMKIDYTVPFIIAKQCALIAVNEILNIDNINPYIIHKEIIEFYQEVKQEIQKL